MHSMIHTADPGNYRPQLAFVTPITMRQSFLFLRAGPGCFDSALVSAGDVRNLPVVPPVRPVQAREYGRNLWIYVGL